MSRTLALALAIMFLGTMLADDAAAKKRKRGYYWSRYDATMVCDVADTTVLVNNPSKTDVTVLVRLTDAMGDTQHMLTVPAEGIATFDCTSTGVTTTGVLSFEGPRSLHATATYVGANGSVDVERLVPVGVSGKKPPHDDSDTGDSDSDSAAGDPTPM